MKRTASIGGFLLLSAVLATAVSGCGFKDIDKRFFVVATGIDATGNPDKPFKITLRLAIPHTKVESGEAHTEIETIESRSIAEGIRQLKATVDKELDFGQCRVFLLGEPMVRQSIDDALLWMSRRRDIQQIAYIGIARPSASELVRQQPKSERYPGNAFFLTFGKEGTESTHISTVYLYDLVRRHYETGLDPYLPVVVFDGDSYRVDRVALMDKSKLRLVLTPDETQLFNLLAESEHNSGYAADNKGKRIVIFNSHVRVGRSISREAVPVVTVRVRLRSVVEESPGAIMDGHLTAIERLLSESLADDTHRLLNKIREAGVDPFGFGLHYLASRFGDAADWERWKRVYPHVTFRVRARVAIESSGLMQ